MFQRFLKVFPEVVRGFQRFFKDFSEVFRGPPQRQISLSEALSLVGFAPPLSARVCVCVCVCVIDVVGHYIEKSEGNDPFRRHYIKSM